MIRIVDWEQHFENAQSRKYKHVSWVPMPNKRGVGYVKMLRQKNGEAMFGCWCTLVEYASTRPTRGIIEDTLSDLSLLLLYSERTISETVAFCNALGWIEICERSEHAGSTLVVDSECAGSTPPVSVLFSSVLTEEGCGEKQPAAPTWKTSYPVYKTEHDSAYAQLLGDPEWLSAMARLNPGIDVRLSMEKASRFWGSEDGWKHKKKARTKEIVWRRTYENALSIPLNRVYPPRGSGPVALAQDDHYRSANGQ